MPCMNLFDFIDFFLHSSPKPTYQRPELANGVTQNPNVVGDRYKASGVPSNPPMSRPYGNPPSLKGHYPSGKESMYDSGVDTYYNAKPKKDSGLVRWVSVAGPLRGWLTSA